MKLATHALVTRSWKAAALVALAVGILMPLNPAAVSAGHFTTWIHARAPFAGVWNYDNNAPPGTHHTPWGGDRAVDYYKTSGTYGYYRATFSGGGGYPYAVVASNGSSCGDPNVWAGRAYVLSLYEPGQTYRGWYTVAHIKDSSGGYSVGTTLTNGTFLGTTYFWTGAGNCSAVSTSAGVQWHLEFWQPTHYSCYYPYGPNTSLAANDVLGAVGSNATGPGASCW